MKKVLLSFQDDNNINTGTSLPRLRQGVRGGRGGGQ